MRPIEILASELRHVLTAACAHASTDAARPLLASVYFIGRSNGVEVSATDGRRAYRVTVAADERFAACGECAIDLATARRMLAQLPAAKGARVAFGMSEGGEVKVGKVAGQRNAKVTRPPFDQVWPGACETWINVDGAALLDACEALKCAASPRTMSAALAFDATGELSIRVEDHETGDASDAVALVSRPAKSGRIGVNLAYFCDSLRAVGAAEGETLAIGVSGELDPLVFSSGQGCRGAPALLMPMRM